MSIISNIINVADGKYKNSTTFQKKIMFFKKNVDKLTFVSYNNN